MELQNACDKIKTSLDGLIGKRVRLKANKGRRKIMEAEGVIEETYPKLFVIKLDGQGDSFRRVSYTYSDVLTETVQLSIFGDNGEQSRLKSIII